MSTTNAQTSAMMPAELSLLTNENENIPPFSSVSIALPSVPPLGERSVNVPTPAATTLTLTEQEKKQLKKAQKKAMDNVEKRRLIDEANRRERRNESLVPLVITQKERKSVIRFEDDLKPAFYPGAYVRVDRDYSPGKNRQEAVFSYDGESPKRKRTPVESFLTINLPAQKKQAIDDRSPIEKLIAILEDGASKGKKKGWYLKELRVTDKEKNRLSNVETQRLWTEVQLLESYLNYSQSRKPRRKNTISGKFMKSSATSKALTLTYLVQTAYGRGCCFLARLRKKARESDGSIGAVIPLKEKKNDDIDHDHCIIEDREMAKSKNTAKHLYALNACRDALAKFSTEDGGMARKDKKHISAPGI